MKVCSGTKIDSITITNYDNTVTKVGGSGGTRCQTIGLNGVAVYAISGFYAMDGVRELNIFTGAGTYNFGEATGLLNFHYDSGSRGLSGLIGRSGSIIDAIGVVF